MELAGPQSSAMDLRADTVIFTMMVSGLAMRRIKTQKLATQYVVDARDI